MSSSTEDIYRLACYPNNYPWGPQGQSSLAAQYAHLGATPEFEVDPKEHYAELWMGTHPNNPSKLWMQEEGEGRLLSALLAHRPELLGSARQRFDAPFDKQSEDVKGNAAAGEHVPFLFKILCAGSPLNLQIHPNVKLAKQLHEREPDKFPDTNHKPEIAVCFSDRFLGFANFRPYDQIRALLSSAPEIQHLPRSIRDGVDRFLSAAGPTGTLGGAGEMVTSLDDPTENALRKLWGDLVALSAKELGDTTTAFTKRVEREGTAAFPPELKERDRANLVEAVGIMQRCNPGDEGIFATALFMNLVELEKGDGMYVGADGVHVWITGDIVELMAISDNVLNVGFLPDQESKDNTRLVAQAMTARQTDPGSIILSHKPFSKGTKGHTEVYSVPFEEFSILRIAGEEELEALDGPMIAIVTSGQVSLGQAAEKAGEGSVWFVGAGTRLKVSGEGDVWAAFYDACADPAEVGGSSLVLVGL